MWEACPQAEPTPLSQSFQDFQLLGNATASVDAPCVKHLFALANAQRGMEVHDGADVSRDDLEKIANTVLLGTRGQQDSVFLGEAVELEIWMVPDDAVAFLGMAVHCECFGTSIDNNATFLFHGDDSNKDRKSALVIIVNTTFRAVCVGENIGPWSDFGEGVIFRCRASGQRTAGAGQGSPIQGVLKNA